MTVIKFGKMEIVLDVKVEELEPCKGKVIPSWSYRHMKNVKFFVHQDEKGNVKIKKLL